MKYFEANEVHGETLRVLKERPNPYVAYTIHKDNWVYSSNLNQTNKDYCKENNINLSESYNMGGTIVASKGDIDIALFKIDGWDIGKNLLKRVKEYLDTKIENVSINNNDLLIDNKYKVMSYASINAGDRYIYVVVHISINPDKELINKICNKEMIKIPRGLGDYGVTTKEMEELMEKITNEEVLNNE